MKLLALGQALLGMLSVRKADKRIEGQVPNLNPQIPGFYPNEMARNLLSSIRRDSLPRVMFQHKYSDFKARLLGDAFLILGITNYNISPYADEHNEHVMKVSIK